MADQPIGGIKLEITGDIKGLQKAVAEGKISVDQLGKFLEQRLDKSTTAAERSVNRLVKELTGVRPTAQLNNLAVALEKIGGTSKLTEIQVGNLAKRIDSLRAAGGTVPASLQSITASANGLGAAVNNIKAEGLQKLSASAGSLGTLGSAMSAAGPAGMAAAAGISVTIGAATGLGKVLLDASNAAIKHASATADAAARANMSAEAYQSLALSGSLVGASAESMAKSVHTLNQALIKTPERLGAIGLSAAELRGLAPEEQFRKVAEALEAIEDPAYRDVLAIDLLGKKASEVTLTLKAFGEGGAARFRELGAIMSDETVEALDKVDDSLTILEKTWDGFWNNLGASIVKGADAVKIIDGLSDSIGALSRVASTLQLGKLPELVGVFTGLGQLPTIGRFLRNRDFQNYSLPMDGGLLDDAAAGGGDSGPLGSAINDYEEFIKLNPQVAASIAKIREERKKLTEETKKAEAEEKKLQDRMREIAGQGLAVQFDADSKAIQRLGGYAQIAADQLDKLAKKYAGTAHAIPFLMEQGNRAAAFEQDRLGAGSLALPQGFIEEQLAKKLGMTTLLARMQESAARAGDAGLMLPPGFTGPLEHGTQGHFDALARARGFEDFASATDEAKKEIMDLGKAAASTAKTQLRMSEIISAVSDFARVLGVDLEKGFGRLFGAAGAAAAGGRGLKDSLAFEDGKLDLKASDITGAIVSGFGAVASILQANKGGDPLGNLLGSGMAGASAGAAFGPKGALIGAGMGSMFSAGSSLAKSGNTAAAIGLGMFSPVAGLGALFGGLDKKKSDQARREAMERMERSTGLDAFDDFQEQMRKGGMTAKEMASSFDAAFNEILPHALSKTTGLLTEAGVKMLDLAKSSGIASEAVKQLMAAQSQALAGNLAGGITNLKTSREQGGGGLVSQSAATGIGASFAASFDQLVKNGMSANEALKQLAPSVRDFRAELTAAGFEGGAAFEALEHRVAILTGEVTGPLVEGIGSFSGALANMSNLGILTQEIFSGITSQIGANIEALKVQGVEGPAAIAALQPQLQTIWELQQKHGFEVDKTTQGLIDLGLTSGQIGPQFKSQGEQMKDIMERVALAVERLANSLAGAEGKAAGLGNKINGLQNKTITVHTNFTKSGGGPSNDDDSGELEKFATGTLGSGSLFRNFGAETMAALHGLEAVMTVPQLERFATNAATFGASSTFGGASMDIAPIVERLDRLERAILRMEPSIVSGMRDAVQQIA